MHLDTCLWQMFAFDFFFFFLFEKHISMAIFSFQWVHKPFYSTIFSLKMDLMVLFTHFKIILL